MEQRYELLMTGEAEVTAGPLHRLRDLIQAAVTEGRQLDPAEVSALVDELDEGMTQR